MRRCTQVLTLDSVEHPVRLLRIPNLSTPKSPSFHTSGLRAGIQRLDRILTKIETPHPRRGLLTHSSAGNSRSNTTSHEVVKEPPRLHRIKYEVRKPRNSVEPAKYMVKATKLRSVPREQRHKLPKIQLLAKPAVETLEAAGEHDRELAEWGTSSNSGYPVYSEIL